MKNIKIIFLWLLIAVASFQVGYCQPPDATANFVKVEKEITTTPEFPGICDLSIGVEVTINEDYEEYIWIFPFNPNVNTSKPPLSGKQVKLTETGTWTIRCFYTVNNVRCSETKELYVADLKDPTQIQKYFENAGFWPIQIYKQALFNPEPIPCRNCSCDAELESVSFSNGGDFLKLTNEFENFSDFRPFQGMDYQKNITNNSCLCNGDGTTNIPEFENSLGSGELSVWGHQFFKNQNTLGGTLYLKASMAWEKASPNGPHRNRLDEIKNQLLSTGNTAEQGRKIFTNLFMNQPIGGYDLIPTCPDPEGCFAEGNFLTPAGVLTKLPDGAQFAFGDGTNGGPRGTLLAYNDNQGNSRQAYNYKSDAFAGFYNDLSVTVTSDLETVGVSTEGNDRIVLIEKGDSECFKSLVPFKASVANSDSWGGIGYNIIKNNTINAITPKVFESVNPGEIKIAFMAPTAGIISIERSFSNIELNYTKTENATVENFVGGMLWSFDQLNHETCEINSFEYQPGGSYYLDKVANVIYQDNHGDAENFEYIMACNGTYNSYSLKRGSLENHADGSPNYDNNFEGLTNLFIPFSPQNDIASASGIIIGDVPSCAFCPSQEFSQLIIKEKYCLHPEHIFVEKIGQLATVYPDYFKDPEEYANNLNVCNFPFTQNERWEIPVEIPIFGVPNAYFNPNNYWPWSSFLANNPEVAPKLETNTVEFFKSFIDQLKSQTEAQLAWWNEDIGSKTVDEIICHLSGEPQSITTSVPWTKKFIALDKVDDGVIYERKEDAIIHLLASSGSGDAINYATNIKEIQFFWDNFGNAFGTDNLTRVLLLISSHINNESPNNYVANIKSYFDQPRNIPVVEADLLNWENLTPSVFGNVVRLNTDINPTGLHFLFDDIIPLKMGGKITIQGVTYQKDAVIYVPAIQAALFGHVNTTTVAERTGWVAIDLGGLALGFGGAKILLSAGNYLRKAVVLGDLVGSAAGLTAQFVPNHIIDDDLRSQIQMISLWISAPQIGLSLVEAVGKTRKLKKDYPSNQDALFTSNEVRKEIARSDLYDYPEEWAFVQINPKAMDAWEALIEESNLVRKNKLNLETVANHMDEVGKTPDVIAAEIKASGSFDNWMADYFVTYNRNGYKLNKNSIDFQYSNHLNIIDGPVTSSSGVKGGHNVQAFMNEVYDATSNPNKRVVILNNPSFSNGWSLFEYKLYKANPAGIPTIPLELPAGQPFKKTVYDPNIVSENSLKKAGYKAFKNAIDNNKIGQNYGGFPNSFEGTSDGIEYSGFFDLATKIIITWYVK